MLDEARIGFGILMAIVVYATGRFTAAIKHRTDQVKQNTVQAERLRNMALQLERVQGEVKALDSKHHVMDKELGQIATECRAVVQSNKQLSEDVNRLILLLSLDGYDRRDS